MPSSGHCIHPNPTARKRPRTCLTLRVPFPAPGQPTQAPTSCHPPTLSGAGGAHPEAPLGASVMALVPHLGSSSLSPVGQAQPKHVLVPPPWSPRPYLGGSLWGSLVLSSHLRGPPSQGPSLRQKLSQGLQWSSSPSGSPKGQGHLLLPTLAIARAGQREGTLRSRNCSFALSGKKWPKFWQGDRMRTQ